MNKKFQSFLLDFLNQVNYVGIQLGQVVGVVEEWAVAWDL